MAYRDVSRYLSQVYWPRRSVWPHQLITAGDNGCVVALNRLMDHSVSEGQYRLPPVQICAGNSKGRVRFIDLGSAPCGQILFQRVKEGTIENTSGGLQ